MNDTPDKIPWGLIGEPHWISELDDASEPKPEEDPFPLRMQHLGYESKLEGELFPQKSNDKVDWREMLFLQPRDEYEPQIKDQRSLTNEESNSASDTNEGTMEANDQMHQISKSPNAKSKKRTMKQLQPQNTMTQQWSDMQQCNSDGSLIQTSAHYSKMSKLND